MTEQVAITTGDHWDRDAFHEIDDDGEVTCPTGQVPDAKFQIVPLDQVDDDLERCQHCQGESHSEPGRGGPLTAKLAAADPDEVSIR